IKDLVLNFFRVRDSLIVKFSQTIVTSTCLFSKDDRNDLQPLFDAIESDHVSIKHPDGVSRGVEWLRMIVAQRRFEPLRRVVTEITDSAACKRHETGSTSKRTSAEVISNPLSRDDRISFSRTVAFDNSLHSFAAHDHLGLRAEE